MRHSARLTDFTGSVQSFYRRNNVALVPLSCPSLMNTLIQRDVRLHLLDERYRTIIYPPSLNHIVDHRNDDDPNENDWSPVEAFKSHRYRIRPEGPR